MPLPGTSMGRSMRSIGNRYEHLLRRGTVLILSSQGEHADTSDTSATSATSATNLLHLYSFNKEDSELRYHLRGPIQALYGLGPGRGGHVRRHVPL